MKNIETSFSDRLLIVFLKLYLQFYFVGIKHKPTFDKFIIFTLIRYHQFA